MQPVIPRFRVHFALLAAAVVLPAAYAVAQGVPQAAGLRGGLPSGCVSDVLCNVEQGPARAAAPLGGSLDLGPVSVDASGPAPVFSSGTAGLGISGRQEGVAYEASIGLRGQYRLGGDNPGFSVIVVPQGAVRLAGSRLAAEATASAELVQDIPGEPRFGAVDVAASASYALDSVTRAHAAASARLSQDHPDTLSDMPGPVMTAPLAFTGEATSGVTRTIGRNIYGAEVSLARETATDAILEDGTRVSTPEDHFTRYGAGLRLGREISPALVAFGELGATRTDYDLIARDNWAYRTVAGVELQWHRLGGEVSAGSLWRAYDGDIESTQSLFFGAEIAYMPLPDVALSAAFTTALLPAEESESGVAARQSGVEVGAGYRANPWLGLTADASYLVEVDEGGAVAHESYGGGVGADWSWLPHTTVSAGYGYRVTNGAAATTGDEHRFTLGVTLEP